MSVKTVGQLIEKLKQFDENAGLDVKVLWYDRNNFQVAHREVCDYKDGIELCVTEENGVVIIENENTEDIRVYD